MSDAVCVAEKQPRNAGFVIIVGWLLLQFVSQVLKTVSEMKERREKGGVGQRHVGGGRREKRCGFD